MPSSDRVVLIDLTCRRNSQRTIDELRANVADLENRLRNETSRLKNRYETERHELEMQIDVLSRGNAELSKNNKGLLAKLKVPETNAEIVLHSPTLSFYYVKCRSVKLSKYLDLKM